MSNYKHIVALFCLKKSSNFSLLFYSIVGTFLLPFISTVLTTHGFSHIRTKQTKHSTTYNFFTHRYFFYVGTSASWTMWCICILLSCLFVTFLLFQISFELTHLQLIFDRIYFCCMCYKIL